VNPAATEAPVIAPPDATEAPAPTETAQEPTEPPAAPTETDQPTEAAVEPTEEPTEAPAPPASASSGALDFEIADLQIGESLPDLTLGPLQNEQWVVVTIDVENAGSDLATLDMTGFTLKTAEGDELALDSATGAVATFLGMGEGNGTKDTREIGPGERASVVLVFVPPAGATGLTLQAGDASIPLEAGATGQTGGDRQTADDLSTQLLTNSFTQYDMLSPTANAKIVPLVGNPWESSEE
jgi:hypothetical protein